MSYNLANIEELRQFDMDCAAACSACQNYSAKRSPVCMGHNVISVALVFTTWFRCETIWGSGYKASLTPKAKQTFKRYAMFRDGRVYDSVTNTVFAITDTFRIREKYIRS